MLFPSSTFPSLRLVQRRQKATAAVALSRAGGGSGGVQGGDRALQGGWGSYGFQGGRGSGGGDGTLQVGRGSGGACRAGGGSGSGDGAL